MSVEKIRVENLRSLVDTEAGESGRKRAGYRAVAVATGLGEEYIYQLYTGRKEVLGRDAAEAIARAYANGRDLSWFDQPIGAQGEPPSPAKTPPDPTARLEYAAAWEYKGAVPVIAVAKADKNGFVEQQVFEGDSGGWVPSVSSSGGRQYAVRIKGDGLSPALKHGTFILVEPDAPLEAGERIAVRFKDGRSAILDLVIQRPDSLTVEPVIGGEKSTLDIDEIEFAHAIVGTCAASKWVKERP